MAATRRAAGMDSTALPSGAGFKTLEVPCVGGGAPAVKHRGECDPSVAISFAPSSVCAMTLPVPTEEHTSSRDCGLTERPATAAPSDSTNYSSTVRCRRAKWRMS